MFAHEFPREEFQDLEEVDTHEVLDLTLLSKI